MSSQGPDPSSGAPQCYRHPGRETWIRCQRCDRPICPDCMNPASVGFQCPECLREGRRTQRAPRTRYGGKQGANPHQTTIGLIVANVVVFLAILANGGTNGRVFQLLSLLPAGRCDSRDLSGFYPNIHAVGLCHSQAGHWFPGVADGAWWQIVTSFFTQGEVLHIGFNMVALYFLGPPLEMILGRARFLAVYFLSGLAGSAAVMLFAGPQSLTEGASGAIFGLMGALVVVGLRSGINMQQIWLWIGLNLVFTFTAGGISWQGHIGGLLGGAAVAGVLVLAPHRGRTPVQVAGGTVLGVVLLVIIAARAIALGG